MQDIEKLTRDCRPATTPLKSSYYHGACLEPLSGETIGEVLRTAAIESPDHVVFRTHEFHESITLHDLQKRAEVASRALLSAGLKRGDIVLLAGVTDIEYFVIYFAITQIGLVFLNPQIDEPFDKDTRIFCNMKPSAVFVGREVEQVTMEVIQEYVQSRDVRVPVVAVNVENKSPSVIGYKEFLNDEIPLSTEEYSTALDAVSIDDVAVLFVSSGTSSSCHKTSCATQHLIVNLARFTHQRVSPVKAQEVLGCLNPMIDDAGCVIQLVRAVYNRAVAVIGPPSMTPTPEASEIFMTFIQEERITWHCGMPFELIHSLNSPMRQKYDLSSLRGGNLLGQITSIETKKELFKIYPDIVTFFGATEALAGLSTSIIWSTEEQRLNTVGYPYAHCEVKLVGSNGRTVKIGEPGELCIRGWSVFKKYLNNKELTASAKAVEKNGWYHYGDICTMDTTGHVTYIGRVSDCVRFKHYSDTVYPVKILNVIQKHKSVHIAKVIGIPCDEKGDDICLCVEPKPGANITEQEMKDLMHNEIQENMKPDYYFVFETLPRTGARKKIAMKELEQIVRNKLEGLRKH